MCAWRGRGVLAPVLQRRPIQGGNPAGRVTGRSPSPSPHLTCLFSNRAGQAGHRIWTRYACSRLESTFGRTQPCQSLCVGSFSGLPWLPSNILPCVLGCLVFLPRQASSIDRSSLPPVRISTKSQRTRENGQLNAPRLARIPIQHLGSPAVQMPKGNCLHRRSASEEDFILRRPCGIMTDPYPDRRRDNREDTVLLVLPLALPCALVQDASRRQNGR